MTQTPHKSISIMIHKDATTNNEPIEKINNINIDIIC